jgi:uncharacterized membrane protein
MFASALNKVTVPVLELSLGFFLAMQGTIAIFAISLVLLARYGAFPCASSRHRPDR